MPDRAQRAFWLEVGFAALAAVVFFRSGLLLLVFMIPIQLVWVWRGERAGLTSSGLFLVGLGLMKVVDYLRIREALAVTDGGLGLMFLDIVLPAAFLTGLYLLNAPRLRVRTASGQADLTVIWRFAAAMLIAVGVTVPAIVLVHLSGAVDGFIAGQAALLGSLLDAVGATEQELQELSRIALRIFLSGFAFGYFVLLVGSWWLGSRLALRRKAPVGGPNPVAERLRSLNVVGYRLPTGMVWLAVGALAAVLITLLADVGWWAYVIWNAALLVLAVYAIQGVGVIWHLMDRKKVSRSARLGIATGLIVGILIPGLNLVFLLGLPGLGISEVWVNYHRFERSGDEQ